MPELKGISHVQLTVSDCDRAADWWRTVMGFVLIHQARHENFEARNLIHPTGVAVGIVTHDNSLAGAFDERHVGLDHLSFAVADRDELQRWLMHLEAKAVAHSGIQETGFGPLVVFRDPDNIQVELFVHPTGDEVMEVLSDADSPEVAQAVRAAGEEA